MDNINDMKSLKHQMKKKLCLICRFKSNFFNWCNKCKLKHFQFNYGEFPSENNEIDNFLKDIYCKIEKSKELIEWIPYNELEKITFIDEESSKLYYASWSNGYICDWNENKLNWSRKIKENQVLLKNFENLEDLFKQNVSFFK
ncbi:hypothetical protein C1645_814102 [Glomus cerebriforme]|uniref:Uncharacterized protein n=1 Tax=Glomus cerebriforme TaxID=658196 RepID=A0A397TKE5_9GLOM|nr:hypothetical protein C1645_814102 [Glomus cerebriforme]